MEIVVNESTVATPGNFNAKLIGGSLGLPADIVQKLKMIGVKTAEELITFLDNFPTSMQIAIGWSFQDLTLSRVALAEILQDQIHDEILNPRPREDYSFGALDPEHLK